jgi:plastocyanin domain-containing protein
MKKMKLFLVLAALIVGLGGAFAVATNIVEAHTRTIKIRVDKNGFSPSSIEVEAGHKLNLVFNRADKNNCGNKVVFPKLKIRKNLPVGKDVIVSFTPTEAGQVTFTCGMGMMKGSIVVTD